MASDPKYISQSDLAALLDSAGAATAVVDCRDNDRREGGWVNNSIHFPSRSATPEAFAALFDSLKSKNIENVVFHCMFSQARGPGSANAFVGMFSPSVRGNMRVMILQGGFRGFYHWAKEHQRADLITQSGYGFL